VGGYLRQLIGFAMKVALIGIAYLGFTKAIRTRSN
jgi:hypothetical protein